MCHAMPWCAMLCQSQYQHRCPALPCRFHPARRNQHPSASGLSLLPHLAASNPQLPFGHQLLLILPRSAMAMAAATPPREAKPRLSVMTTPIANTVHDTRTYAHVCTCVHGVRMYMCARMYRRMHARPPAHPRAHPPARLPVRPPTHLHTLMHARTLARSIACPYACLVARMIACSHAQ